MHTNIEIPLYISRVLQKVVSFWRVSAAFSFAVEPLLVDTSWVIYIYIYYLNMRDVTIIGEKSD
jgi:hypothetical protein